MKLEILLGTKSWQNYLPLLHKIFEENNNIKGLRIFDIVPQFSFHIRINETQFGDNANYYWSQIFDINKYANRFRFFVETDLVGISTSIFKYRKKNTKDEFIEDNCGITNIFGKEVIGRKDLFVAVDNKERVAHYGTKKYRDMARFVKNRRKIKRWLNQNQNIKNLQNVLPTSCVPAKTNFLNHIQFILMHYHTFQSFYGALWFCKIKFDNYVCKQQALSKMCQQIIGKPQDWHYSDVVVAYRSGGFFSSSPGYASGPKKQLYQKLKRRCTIQLVNEFKTSQYAEFAVMAMECYE
nr:7645_t:CDS:2 [Entrophospora candida]